MSATFFTGLSCERLAQPNHRSKNFFAQAGERCLGVAPGDHERIFERFVQGETGDRRRFGGIGLGLYIVRQLARAQDGEVAAASRPGGGTRMSLQLRRGAG